MNPRLGSCVSFSFSSFVHGTDLRTKLNASCHHLMVRTSFDVVTTAAAAATATVAVIATVITITTAASATTSNSIICII